MAWSGHASPAWLYLLAGVQSALTGLQRPSIEAITPRLVDPEEIPAAAALGAFRGSFGMVAGPAVGGLLIGSVGIAATYAIDALTYLVALVCILGIRRSVSAEGGEPPSWKGVVEGFRYARSRQELIGTYLVDFVAMIFGMPMALFPALAEGFGGASVVGLSTPRRRSERWSPA